MLTLCYMLWYIVIILCTHGKRTIFKPRTASYNLYFLLGRLCQRGTSCGPVYVDLSSDKSEQIERALAWRLPSNYFRDHETQTLRLTIVRVIKCLSVCTYRVTQKSCGAFSMHSILGTVQDKMKRISPNVPTVLGTD